MEAQPLQKQHLNETHPKADEVRRLSPQQDALLSMDVAFLPKTSTSVFCVFCICCNSLPVHGGLNDPKLLCSDAALLSNASENGRLFLSLLLLLHQQ